MGFGDFAMGYFLGQSFAGPTGLEGTVPHPSTWMPGKCQGDIDAENDPAVIAAGEKAYWKAWDAACKAKVIERLRNHEEGARFHRSIYPNMTQDEQADLIERGEWRIIAPIGKEGDLCAIWADETREEAQNPAYLAKLKEYKNNIATRGDRIIY